MNRRLITPIRANLAAATLLAIGLGLLFWFGFLRGVLAGRRLLATPLGTDKSVVVAALGEPDEVRGSFRLAEYREYPRETEQAAKAGATEYLVWEYLLDLVCCAGFDESNRLVVRDCGTS